MSEISTVKVVAVNPHPNATKLKVCKVSDGNQEIQVVCGASNVQEGMVTILAQVDSVTPKGLKIQKSDLRGVDSFGMLCSAKDLDIAEEDGIVDLPPTTALGKNYQEIDINLLSSIPWFSYKEVEGFWEDDLKRIWVYRDGAMPEQKNEYQLISKTYFHDGEYRHRHFL